MLNEFIQRLILMRQFSMDGAKIELLKQNQVLLDTDFVSVIQDIDKDKFYELVKNNAKEKVVHYVKVFGSTPDNISVDTLRQLFGSLGFGTIEIVDLNKGEKKAILKVADSPIAKSYISLKKKSKEPVCLFIRAILAGSFSAIFKKDVNCEEKNCLVLGAKKCEFIVK